MPDGLAIITGIISLKSAKTAAWLNANVAGVKVPQALMHEMEGAAGPEAEVRIGSVARKLSFGTSYQH